jgi:ORF6N domain
MQLSIIQNKIFEIRGQKVMLDRDLAEMYEVETRVLNQAVQRNISRFPSDFMFRLSKKEFEFLISQNVISKNAGRGGIRKMPYAFTEQGVAMLSSVLKSEKAVQMNIIIVRTFVLIRQSALNYKDLAEKIKKLEKKYNKNFREIFKALEYLVSEKQTKKDFKNRTRIGFKQ